MKTRGRTTTMAISVAGLFLVSGLLVTPDAFAQSRGRSVRMPTQSTALRGARNSQHASRSGTQGLNALGSLLDSMNRGGYHQESHHDRYSDAEAYRDVGIANAIVGLVGTLLSVDRYPQYPAVTAPPVEVVPVVPAPPPYPVVVVPSPGVIVGPYPYGYAPSSYPYGYYDYKVPYCSPSPMWNAPLGTGYYPEHHGTYGHGNNYGYGPPVTPGNGHNGNYRQPVTSGNSRSGIRRTPTYQRQSVQSPRTFVQRSGAAPSMSVSRGGTRSTRQPSASTFGQSYRIR